MNGIIKILIRLSIINYFLVLFVILYLNTKVAVAKNANGVGMVSNTSEILPTPTTVPKKKTGVVEGKSTVQGFTPNSEPTPTVAGLDVELPLHNIRADCWLKINGNFYNISAYFGSHPGGDSYLIKYCGTDATTGFGTKDSIPAKIHSAAAMLILSRYLIQ